MEWLIKAGGNPEDVPNYSCGQTERKRGSVNYAVGACFITYGIVAELIYTVVLTVMIRKQHRRLSCYKIMIALGIYDMCAISLNSLLTGYFWIVGANYCATPTLMFVSGAIALGLWCGACMNCFVLVVNRLLDLWNKEYMEMLFNNNRTYVVLLLPLAYCLYFTFFTPPLLFSSDHTAWFFAPFMADHNIDEYFNFPHTANNLFIVVVTCLLYVQYSRVLLRHSKTSSGLSWAQKSCFIQSAAICMANLIAALIYVYMQFFPTPSYFVMIGHVCWQLGHGFPAFVYLFLNRTIRREAFALLGLGRFVHKGKSVGVTVTSRVVPVSITTA
ncbi:hypothetical protein Q1695_011949 [Nippostrongylus brasiliensis]|nr:hypothetical protein Q1695_011949 [Nippostrongylus brasiliensis]